MLEKVRCLNYCNNLRAPGIQLQPVNVQMRDAQVKRGCPLIQRCGLQTLLCSLQYQDMNTAQSYVSLASTKTKTDRGNVRCRPQQHILGLCTDGCFSEVFEDVWQLRRDVDLLGTVDCVWKRHGCNMKQWSLVQFSN